MGASQSIDPANVNELVLQETDRRLDTYYELALPGEEDSPIEPMGTGWVWFIVAVGVALFALWLIGRFIILPIYT